MSAATSAPRFCNRKPLFTKFTANSSNASPRTGALRHAARLSRTATAAAAASHTGCAHHARRAGGAPFLSARSPPSARSPTPLMRAPVTIASRRPAGGTTARNFPATLTESEQQRWEDHRIHRLHEGASGCTTVEAFMAQIDTLAETADERGQAILESLGDYATDIAPERGV